VQPTYSVFRGRAPESRAADDPRRLSPPYTAGSLGFTPSRPTTGRPSCVFFAAYSSAKCKTSAPVGIPSPPLSCFDPGGSLSNKLGLDSVPSGYRDDTAALRTQDASIDRAPRQGIPEP